MAMRERTPFQRSLLERLPNLKLLITAGMRNASIDVQAAQDCGVTVCGTAGLPYPTAELTWGLILSLMRQIPREDQATRNGQWQVSMGLGLQGKTLGLMGLGRLGGQVAEVGAAFKMNLIAWSQNLTSERAAEYGARLVDKDELMAQSDILSVHLILSDRTRHLIGPRELGLMKSTAYLVNTSRGPIVDEAALIQALEHHTLPARVWTSSISSHCRSITPFGGSKILSSHRTWDTSPTRRIASFTAKPSTIFRPFSKASPFAFSTLKMQCDRSQ